MNASALNDLPVLGDVDSDELSPAAERKLGDMVMHDYRANGLVYEDREVTEFLNRFGNKILEASGTGASDFEFFLVKDNSLNAFALPGGFIGVHSGLIVAAQNESELASVLAHEMGHVTQRHIARMFGKQHQTSVLTMAAMAIAILAARSNAQAGAGMMAAGTGFAASQQLSFSRDAEREADRVGYQTLVNAGFDPSAMVTFFTRLQQSTRLYENNAPAYLHTHPLTVERIADIQNRVGSQHKFVQESMEYQLVRAKMRVIGDESVDGLRNSLAVFATDDNRQHIVLPAARLYGQAYAYMKLGQWDKAKTALGQAKQALSIPQPMLDRLGIEIRLEQASKNNTPDQAVFDAIAKDAVALRTQHEGQLSTTVLALEALQKAGRFSEIEALLRDELISHPNDPELYERMAESQNALGKRAEHHVSLSYSYELQGAYLPAIEQMQLAKTEARNDFYLHSQIEARLKILQARATEEKKEPH